MQSDELFQPLVTLFHVFYTKNMYWQEGNKYKLNGMKTGLYKIYVIANIYEIFPPHKLSLPLNSGRYSVIEN